MDKKVDSKLPQVDKKTAKLTEVERAYIVTLLAAGHTIREVAAMAAKRGIVISHQAVAKYKPKVTTKVAEIVTDKDDSPLKKGIALKEERVRKLQEIEAIYYARLKQNLAAGHSVDAYEIREWRAMLRDVRDEIEGKGQPPIVNINQQGNFMTVINNALDRVYGAKPDVIEGEYADSD